MMIKTIANCAWILTLALCVTGCMVPNDAGSLEAEGAKWAKLYKEGDLEGLMALYTDDAVVALHGQPALFGKDAIRDFFESRLGSADTEFELDYEVHEIHDDVGYIISKYWLVAKNKASGESYRDAGRSLLVYKNENGQWKIAADIDQSTPDVTWPSPDGLR